MLYSLVVYICVISSYMVYICVINVYYTFTHDYTIVLVTAISLTLAIPCSFGLLD